jgi:hypothetical protein
MATDLPDRGAGPIGNDPATSVGRASEKAMPREGEATPGLRGWFTRRQVLIAGVGCAGALVGFAAGWWVRGPRKPSVIRGYCRTRTTGGKWPDEEPPWESLSGLRIIVSDEAEQHITTSGTDGRYQLTLAPGQYTVVGYRHNMRFSPVRINGQDVRPNPGLVAVPPGGVVEVDFDVEYPRS